jgi:hypothetical protein
MVERVRMTPPPASNDGRFRVGNVAARGNLGPAKKRQRYRFRAALLHLLSVVDPKSGEPNWIVGCKRVIKAMNDGDVRAAKLVFDHAMGQPLASVEVAKVESEFQDEIPEPHMGMSLKELSNNYARMLRSRPRPADESDIDNGSVIEVNVEPPTEHAADIYEQSLSGRRRE